MYSILPDPLHRHRLYSHALDLQEQNRCNTVPGIASGTSSESTNPRNACMSKEIIEEPGSKFFIFIVIPTARESESGIGALGGRSTVKGSGGVNWAVICRET